jgi:flagellar protein FlgJ
LEVYSVNVDLFAAGRNTLANSVDHSAKVLGKIERASGNDDRLKEACRDFEAVLLSQMMKQMRATLPKNDFFGSKDTEDMFQGMIDDEVMKEASRTNSLGLADVIYNQLASPKNR